MSTTNLKSVVWKEGTQYVAQCLDVDVSSFGTTRKEALTNLEEALSLYFEDEPMLGERIQDPQISLVAVEST